MTQDREFLGQDLACSETVDVLEPVDEWNHLLRATLAYRLDCVQWSVRAQHDVGCLRGDEFRGGVTVSNLVKETLNKLVLLNASANGYAPYVEVLRIIRGSAQPALGTGLSLAIEVDDSMTSMREFATQLDLKRVSGEVMHDNFQLGASILVHAIV